MGQSTSSQVTTTEESYSYDELKRLFQIRASQLFTATELAAIHKNLPSKIHHGHISPSNLASFLGISELSNIDESCRSLEVLYRLFVKLGTLPFIDHLPVAHNDGKFYGNPSKKQEEEGVDHVDKDDQDVVDMEDQDTVDMEDQDTVDKEDDIVDKGNMEDLRENVDKENEAMCQGNPSQNSPSFMCPSNSHLLTLTSLLVATAVHMHRLPQIWKQFDYVGLFFWALAEDKQEERNHVENHVDHVNHMDQSDHVDHMDHVERNQDPKNIQKIKQKSAKKSEHAQFIVQVLQDPGLQDQDPANTAKKIDWNSLQTLPDLAAENPPVFNNMHVHTDDLRCIFTLMLVMQASSSQASGTAKLTSTQWRAFDTAARALVRHYSASDRISFVEFRRGMRFTSHFQNTFRHLLQKRVFSEIAEKLSAPEFTPSRLVTEATVAQVAVMLSSDNVVQNVAPNVAPNVAVSTQNLVELYNGSKSGFSIRSLEQKIFKWHAPTLFFVGGKRIKSSNKRYEDFDAEFPRHFRSNESPLQQGQNQNDRLVYAVYITEPWKVSNKANFGNENTVILALQPRADIFVGKSAPVHQGRSVYFNTQGMGIGFGNDQPINKNHVRRYNPGNVSLTIEANLEFAVFRHLTRASANSPNFFHNGHCEHVAAADYEDRFIITDLEVWGIGTTKELDEQKRNWEWEEKQAQARQSVNVRNMGEDRAFMEMVGLVGNHGSGGSV